VTFTKIRTIALCFNSFDEATRLTEKLRKINASIKFVISVNFNDLLEVIGNEENVDCFIVEEAFKEYPSDELLRILKSHKRYQKTAFSLFSTDLSFIDKKFLQIGLHYIFDLHTEIKDVTFNIKKIIEKTAMPMIPANFNVMVLDNNSDFLELMTEHLKELGHKNYQLCHGVNEAKMSLAKNDFDLLLLDWNLDDGTCLDLIEFINTSTVSERTKSAVKMVITGRNDVEDIITLLNYGIKDYLIKPFNFNEFENKLDYALEKTQKKA
jgi:CheY-like chemotaxis protein